MAIIMDKYTTVVMGILCINMFAYNANCQTVINVTSILTPSYLVSESETEYTGYIPDLLDKLSAMLNFTYNIRLVPDNRFGIKNSTTGKWNGLIGELVAENTDMVAAPLTVTASRAEEVDFSHPFQSVGPVIVLKRPDKQKRPLKENLAKLLVPLEFTVWLMSVLAFLVTGTVIYIISHFNPYEWRRMAKDHEASPREAESFTCVNSFWFVLSTMAWQGYMRTPRSMGGRIVVTAWWFFVLILILSYTASLTNMLRVGPAPFELEGYSKIRSFADLARQEDISIGVTKDGSTEQYFRNSQLAEDQIIYEKIKETRKEMLILGGEDGIKEIRKHEFSDFAMIMESSMAKYHIQRPPCNLYIVSENLVTRHYSLAFPAKSLLLPSMNSALLRLRENGELNALENKWFRGTCKNTVLTESSGDRYELPEFYALDLGSFSGALLVVAAGIFLGGLITCIEYCIYKWAETHYDEEDVKAEAHPKAINMTSDAKPDQSLLQPDARKAGATPV